jgi:exopolysaccharide production protein ExoZ
MNRYSPSSGTCLLKKLDTLEAVRAVAALLVVFFHTQAVIAHCTGEATLPRFFGGGDAGVDMFFVLSGFVVTYAHRADFGIPARVWPYLYRRICRIYPAALIMGGLAIVIYALGFDPGKLFKLEPDRLIASLMLLPQSGVALVNVTWTLAYEIFFYLAFSILIVSRRYGVVLLVLWQGAVLIAALGGLDVSPPWAYELRPICLEFGLGVAAAAIFIHRPRSLAGAFAPWAALGFGIALFGGAITLEAYAKVDVPHWPAYGLGAMFIIWAAAVLERKGRMRVPAWLVSIGDASYSIYLVHFSVITLLAIAMVDTGMRVGESGALAIAAAAVAAGMIFHALVDRPVQRFLRLRTARPLHAEPRVRVSDSPSEREIPWGTIGRAGLPDRG